MVSYNWGIPARHEWGALWGEIRARPPFKCHNRVPGPKKKKSGGQGEKFFWGFFFGGPQIFFLKGGEKIIFPSENYPKIFFF